MTDENVILKEIEDCFLSYNNGFRKIKSLSGTYDVFSYNENDEFGIAVCYKQKKDISEEFNNVKLYTKINVITNDSQLNGEAFICLTCNDKSLVREFSLLCTSFAISEEEISLFVNNPVLWWGKWKELIGNVNKTMSVYSVIAELYVLLQLSINDNDGYRWTASHFGSVDIEGTSSNYEVKSTLNKYRSEIEISSQYQLKVDNPTYLVFVRLEKSNDGLSINDLLSQFNPHMKCYEDIEKGLKRLGLERGKSIRDEKYKILEAISYPIDSKFPKITTEEINKILDTNLIIKFQYTIDLKGIVGKPFGAANE